jgi:hypothetical protein
VLLWRKKHLSIGLLVGATLAWILLEKTGYTVVSLVSNITLFLVVILFVWSNLAALLNRSSTCCTLLFVIIRDEQFFRAILTTVHYMDVSYSKPNAAADSRGYEFEC